MQQLLNNILNQRLIPVYSHAESGMNKKVLAACFNAGLNYFEFTNRHTNALEEFSELKNYCARKFPEMILGAGTIKNITDAEMFISAGAAFLVSPLISSELIDFTKKKNILWIPGCSTSTEVGLAENNGLKLVKIFPAKQLGGPGFIEALKGPFPGMEFLATGGIPGDHKTINDYLSVCTAVGIGNSFFSENISENELTQKLKKLISDI